MTHTTKTIVTERSAGIHEIVVLSVQDTPVVQNQIVAVPPFTEVIPTEMDLAWGLDTDITTDLMLEMYLGVVDIDNPPEATSIRSDNAWGDAQNWRVASGSFTLPVETLSHLDPRFFHPKAWANLDVGARSSRRFLCLVAITDGQPVSILAVGNIRWTEIITQRRFGDDNAYADVNDPKDFADDYGYEFDE